MTSIINTPKKIFEKEFKTAMRGYDKREVDEFLDDVIKDYEAYASLVEELQSENDQLKARLKKVTSQPQASRAAGVSLAQRGAVGGLQNRADNPVTNFDILKRISRLEKEVFGKQITE
ncbi:cell division regulator GpsB [Streptococcus halotolerans]|uniref:cell division regulator GpsB n=1 Tax=Streptococcus halotolerans TaxID=1814128 RepID=UPI0007884E61|nr:cell division regulator GpsB [Streptococcus halotolerans]